MRRHIAPPVILLYVVAFLDRVNISFASLSMNRDLHISDSLFGLGAGIFFVGYLLFAVPSNFMLVKLGARPWIAAIMVIWGMLSTSMAFVHGAPLYILLRFLLGAAEAGFFPGIILYLTQWLPSSARARLMASFVVSIPLASVLGAPVSNWILTLGGARGLHGWQWLFLLEGCPAIVLGMLVPLLLSDSVQEAHWLTREEKWSLINAIQQERAPAKLPPKKNQWAALFASPAPGYAVQYFALMIGLYALGFWVPRLLSSRGVAAIYLGWLTALPFALGTIGMLWCSRHSDRTGERKRHLVASFACAGFGMSIAAPRGAWSLALVGLGLAAIGIFSAMPIFWTALTESMDHSLSALAIAFVNSLGNVGGFAGPLLIGTILERTGSYTYGLLFTSASLLCGALLLALLSAGRTSLPLERLPAPQRE